MKLATYMEMTKLTDAQLAEQVGCDRSVITKLRNGTQRPSFRLFQLIKKATHGAVSADDYAEPSEAA